MPETFLLRDLPRYECLEERARRFPDLDAGAVEATLTLMRVGSDVLDGFASHYVRHGTSQGRFLVLMLLERQPEAPLLPSELADKMGVTRATITGLLDGLERDGLIERRIHAHDRRALTVHLTPKARGWLEAMLPDHYRRIADLMADLNPDERRQLIALLAKVAARAGASHTPERAPDPQ